MGLIKVLDHAVIQSGRQVLNDQWKEYFYCEAMSSDVLVTKGIKRTGKKSANDKGSDNIITNGSIVVVSDGQCMIIVDQGKVVEMSAEPGAFKYESSSEPSIFTGRLGDSIKESFKTWGKRITFGGDTANDQRIYYFNTKEIMDNKFGTPTPVPFKMCSGDTGLKITINLKCNGIYSYRITDPIAFYSNVCGNVSENYMRSQIDGQLRTEFIAGLTPAFAELSAEKTDITTLHSHNDEIEAAINKALEADWSRRGLRVASIALNPISISDEDKDKINKAEEASFYSQINLAAGMMASAQANAMEKAASNANGAMSGFMGMGMSMNAGGMNAGELFRQANEGQTRAEAAPSTWTCNCGNVNTGNFCPNCGAKRP